MNLLVLKATTLAVMAALVVGGAWWTKQSYDNAKRAEGVAKVQPKLDAALDQLRNDTEAFISISKSMAALKENSKTLAKSVELSKTKNIERKKQETAQLAAIDLVPITGATSCEQTSNAIRDVFR
jgi:hypothetical protein